MNGGHLGFSFFSLVGSGQQIKVCRPAAVVSTGRRRALGDEGVADGRLSGGEGFELMQACTWRWAAIGRRELQGLLKVLSCG
jgi:hypothetical protein